MAEETGRLIRHELRLAVRELRGKAMRVGMGGALLAVAGLLGLYALDCALGALVALLARTRPTWLAALMVSAGLAATAGLAAAAGVIAVRRGLPLAPESTAESLVAAADAVADEGERS
jgi:hypothetical protein